MKLEITKRDRVLLYLLIIALLLGGGFFFLIKPVFLRHQQVLAGLQQERIAAAEMQSAIERQVSAETAMQEARAAVAQASHTYYAPMNSETVHELMVSLLDSHSVQCSGIQVGALGVKEVASGSSGTQGLLYPFRQELITAGETLDDGSLPGQSGASAALLTVDVTADISGPTSNVLALLDDVAQRKALRVGSYSIDPKTETTQMSLVFTIYMLDQLN